MSDGSVAADRLSYSIYVACNYQTSEEQYQDLVRAASNSTPTIETHGNIWTAFPPGANGRVGFGTFNAIADYPDAVDGVQLLEFHLDHNAGTGAIYRNGALLDDTLDYSVDGGQTDGPWAIGQAAANHGFSGFYFQFRIYRGERPHNSGERMAEAAELNAKWMLY